MSESYGNEASSFYRLWQRFRNEIIQDVPEAHQLCEFDCHKSQCTMGDWEKCESRLNLKAPAKKQT